MIPFLADMEPASTRDMDANITGSLGSFMLSLTLESKLRPDYDIYRHSHQFYSYHQLHHAQGEPLGPQNPYRMPRDLTEASTDHMIRHAERKLNKQRERLCNTAKGRELPECLTTSTTFLSSTPTTSTSLTSPMGGETLGQNGFGLGTLYNVSTTMTIPSPYLPNCSEEFLNAANNATLSTACSNIFANGGLENAGAYPCGPECWPAPFGTLMTIFIAVSLAICIVITTFGNLLVLVSFVVDRQIRQPTNFFIGSLALTDVLIGTVSMPFYTVYVLVGYWPAELGPILCDLWLSVDYTVCLVSQFTVLLITVDRFCSVKIAARYRAWRTGGKVMTMIVVTWIIPAVLFFVSIFGWEHFIGYRDLRDGECMVQFLKDPVFNTSLIIGYYWIPLTILCVLYSFIFEAAWTLSKKSRDKEKERQKLLALAKKPASGAQGASNTAVGIAAVAMTASLATSNPGSKADSSESHSKEKEIEPVDSSQGSDGRSRSNGNKRLPPLLEEETPLSGHVATSVQRPPSISPMPMPPPPLLYQQKEHDQEGMSMSSSNANSTYHTLPLPTVASRHRAQSLNNNCFNSRTLEAKRRKYSFHMPSDISSSSDEPQMTRNPLYLPEPLRPRAAYLKAYDDSFQNSDQNSTLTPTPAPTPSPSVSPPSTVTPTLSGRKGTRPCSLNISGSQTSMQRKSAHSVAFDDDSDVRFMEESSIVLPSPIRGVPEEISSSANEDGFVPDPMSPLSPFDQKTYLYGRPIRKYQKIPQDEIKTNLPLPIMPYSPTSSTPSHNHGLASHHAHYAHHHHFQQDVGLPHFREHSNHCSHDGPQSLAGSGSDYQSSTGDETTSSESDCGECCAGHAPYPFPPLNPSGATSTVSKSTQISPTSVLEMYAAANGQRVAGDTLTSNTSSTAKKLSFQLTNNNHHHHQRCFDETSESGTDKGVQTPSYEGPPPPFLVERTWHCNATKTISALADSPTHRTNGYSSNAHSQRPCAAPAALNVSFQKPERIILPSPPKVIPPKPPIRSETTNISTVLPADSLQGSSSTIPMKSLSTLKANGDATNEIERASTVNEDDPSSATCRDYNNDDSSISGSKKDIMRKIGKRIRFRKRKKDKLKTENRARKALRTISIILGAFVACWTPYHILAIIASFRPEAVNVHLYMFSYFLCYANSPINPFCYAASNQQFKNAFKRIMRGDLSMK